jgi:hypothetical protein
MATTLIIYQDGTDYKYKDAAPSVDLQEKTITICDAENGVLEVIGFKDVAEVIFTIKKD